MDLRLFLWTMGTGTMLAALAWGLVLFRVDPDEAGIVGHVLFYVTLFATLVGAFCVFGTWIRMRRTKDTHLNSRAVKISFRHGIMLASVCVATLALSAMNWLHWWNVLLLIVFVGAIEYACLLIQETRRE